jgi:hypothetical protein
MKFNKNSFSRFRENRHFVLVAHIFKFTGHRPKLDKLLNTEYAEALISLWLFLFSIFLFASQPKEFFLGWVEEFRTTKS